MPSHNLTALAAPVLVAALLAGCAASASKPYGGSGGMAAYNITPDVYTHHYQHGFTGRDAMGWDANLQWAWSRIGAAKTCGVPYAADKVLAQLIATYGHSETAHGMVGIDFHHLQSKGVPGFCSEARVAEVRQQLPAFEMGRFVKRW